MYNSPNFTQKHKKKEVVEEESEGWRKKESYCLSSKTPLSNNHPTNSFPHTSSPNTHTLLFFQELKKKTFQTSTPFDLCKKTIQHNTLSSKIQNTISIKNKKKCKTFEFFNLKLRNQAQ